jgi:hypothetical protein
MENYKRAVAVFVITSLVITVVGLDGCSKKVTVHNGQGNAPATTYATPTPDQLYQLVAPVALFPDNLLAQVLAASTYPDQVSAANQWLQQNAGLKGQSLMQTVDQQPWDASVKGLTQFPDVLNQMAGNLSWTSALGDAYYNIPQNVMNAVQVMRQRAYQAGNLKTSPQQNVSVQNEAPGATTAPASSGQAQTTIVQPPPQTIVIQPAQPEVVYVPTYNPTVVYGAPVPAYPGYSTGEMVATGLISFGVGMAVGAAISGGGGCCGWGWNSWGCGWHNNTVVYNRNVYVSNSNTFVNRNNYYNRNVNNANFNNANINNVNRNNLNSNNINRNNYNANNINRNNRTNNFNGSTPNFNQKYNQGQFKNVNQGNLDRGGQPNFNQQNRPGNQGGNNFNQGRQGQGAGQPNFNQQNRAGAGGNSPRANNLDQGQRQQAQLGGGQQPNFNQNRQAQRGYGQQASPAAGNSAFGNYGEGGSARTNSARGQQSLERGSGGGGGGGSSGGGHFGGGRGGGGGGGGGGRRR